MRAIIDADSLVYAAGFTAQKEHWLACTEDGFVVADFKSKKDAKKLCEEEGLELDSYIEADDEDVAIYNLAASLESILDWTSPSEANIYITDSSDNNWRIPYSTIWRYKANRDNMKRPIHYQALRSYIMQVWGAFHVTDIEADDAVIMDAYACDKLDKDWVICGIDKDLRQKSGKHFNPKKPEEGIFFIDREEAARNFYTQLLTGDKIDNIPGLSKKAPEKGIGPATAANLLAACSKERELFDVCLQAYTKEYGTTHSYITHDGQEVERPTMETLDENAQLLYLARFDGDKWTVPNNDRGFRLRW